MLLHGTDAIVISQIVDQSQTKQFKGYRQIQVAIPGWSIYNFNEIKRKSYEQSLLVT